LKILDVSKGLIKSHSNSFAARRGIKFAARKQTVVTGNNVPFLVAHISKFNNGLHNEQQALSDSALNIKKRAHRRWPLPMNFRDKSMVNVCCKL
jgi:hypothetical protein